MKLKEFDVPYEVHIMSAHRTPDAAAEFSKNAKKNGFSVIIAAAGMAAHLAGVLAAHTTLPVIGIPIKSAAFDGMDALLATVMMPTGIPVATVAVDGAGNAALLAIQMLALSDDTLADKLEAMKADMAEVVAKKDADIQAKVAEL
jgi:5-(carboxyamino)imidazole ribonucleotide mutase